MPESAKILIIDDDRFVLSVLEHMLQMAGYQTIVLYESAKAIEVIKASDPDLILLDVNMPGIGGFEICRSLKQDESLKEIPIIFISGLNSAADKINGFKVGGTDYITKPFHVDEVQARVGAHLRTRFLQFKLEQQKLVEEKIREISAAQAATTFAVAKLAESRDEDTGSHLERVREYCILLSRQLSEDSLYMDQITDEYIDCIWHAAPLHDIGKVAIPDSILRKPGRFTPEEFKKMQVHTVIGAENMQDVFNQYPGNNFIGMGIEIALYHHEHWDGAGYPDGLRGRNIPLSARIMAVADVYDALRSDRCYRKGLSHEEAEKIILDAEGSHFDPEVIKAFRRVSPEFCRIQAEFS